MKIWRRVCICLGLALLMALVVLPVPGDRAEAAGPPEVYYGDQWVDFETRPVIDDGSLLVPLRQAAETLGALVTWDGKGAVVLAKDTDTICLRLGSRTAEVRGRKHTLGAAPRLQDGQVLAPLRFVAEALGYGVDWKSGDRVVLRAPQLDVAGQVRSGDAFPLYEGADPLVLSGPPGEVPGGAAVRVLEKGPDWVRIKHGTVEGWLPAWYLADDGPAVTVAAADFRALGGAAEGLLYPDGPKAVTLERGDLVRPVLQWADWVMVERLYFDLPAVRWAWVPAAALAGEAQPREGFLREGSTVYFADKYEDINRAGPEIQDFMMQVRLGERRGDYVRLDAPAGWRAWTAAENIYFSHDPEQQLRREVYDLLAGWNQLYRVDDTTVELRTLRATPLSVAAEYFTSVVTVIDLDDPAKWPPQQGRIQYLEENRDRLSPQACRRVQEQIDFWDRELRGLYLGVPSQGNASLKVEAELGAWGQIKKESVRFYLEGAQSGEYYPLDIDEIMRSPEQWARVGYEEMRQLADE